MTQATTVVLLCSHLADRRFRLSLPAIAEHISLARPGITVVVVDEVCWDFERIGSSIPASAERAVLGLCAPYAWTPGAERTFREFGIDPLGVETINIAATIALAPPGLEDEHASAQLLARVARTEVFAGSRPEHVVPLVPGRGEPMTRRRLFRLPSIEHKAVAVLRPSRCMSTEGCRECVDVCPRMAISLSGSEVTLSRQRCDSCGVCLELCPRGAIDHARETREGLDAEIEALLGFAPNSHAVTGLIFACRGDLGTLAASSRKAAVGWWMLVEMPCTGAVSAALLLRCLSAGAGAVAVSSCGDGCRFGLSQRVEETLDYMQRWLEATGCQLNVAQLVRPADGSLTKTLCAPVAGITPSAGPLTDITPAVAARHSASLTAGNVRLQHPASPFGVVEVGEACTLCGVCDESCPASAFDLRQDGAVISLFFDPDRCNGCGVCTGRCPEAAAGAISSSKATDLDALRAGRRVLREDLTRRCELCGAPTQPAAMLRKIEERLRGSAHTALLEAITRRCAECRLSRPSLGA
jgi:ferredoxin